jgi:alkylated DNA repair protein (DNA oxidative demethylase)
MLVLPKGVRHIPGHLDRDEQQGLLEDIRAVVGGTALPPGNAAHRQAVERAHDQLRRAGLGGRQGAVTAIRTSIRSPAAPWPPIPDALLKLWDDLTAVIHVRRRPAWSISTIPAPADGPAPGPRRGAISPLRSCRSRSATPACSGSVEPSDGNRPDRSGWKAATWSFWAVKAGLCFHGVDRIYPTTSTLLKDGGRINLTLRRVTGS